METSSEQQMWLLFFKEDETEGKAGVEKALPSLLLPGPVASAPSTVLRLLVQVDSRCPVPGAMPRPLHSPQMAEQPWSVELSAPSAGCPCWPRRPPTSQIMTSQLPLLLPQAAVTH